MNKLMKLLAIPLTLILLSGCGDIKGEITDQIKSEVKSKGKELVKDKVDDVFNEIEKKTAKKSGKIKVDKVVDGDTFKSGNKTYRLVLVDTPETVHPTMGEQPFGKEASNFTKKMLTGKTVEIEHDAQATDKYGRDLVYVWFDKKHNFNAELIKKGYARVMSIAPNTRYLDEFEALQKQAKDKKLGLWQYTNY